MWESSTSDATAVGLGRSPIEEEDRIKQFSLPLLQMLITLLADTGLRVKKEALPLRWSDVLLDSEPVAFGYLTQKVRPVYAPCG